MLPTSSSRRKSRATSSASAGAEGPKQVQLPHGRRSASAEERPWASSPTHELVEEGDALAVVRRSFEAG